VRLKTEKVKKLPGPIHLIAPVGAPGVG
jgi:hypothetical protein